MNFRLAISSFPPPGDPMRRRVVEALSASTGLSVDLLESRLESSPSWLFEVPNREEAEAWRTLLNRQRTVAVAALPALGAPTRSYINALPQARAALSGGPTRPANRGSMADRRAPDHRTPAPGGGSRAHAPRSISMPETSERRPRTERSGPDIDPSPSPRRGITAPVTFLGNGTSTPDTEPQVQSLSEMLEHQEQPSTRTPALDGGDLILEQRTRTRGHAPTVAPAGLRREAIDVRVSTSERVLGPLIRFLVPALLLAGGVFAWRYANRPVVDMPALSEIELLEDGRIPRETLRYAVIEDDERFSVALSIEHRVATRQVQARPVIDTIGGEARLERTKTGEGFYDFDPSGRETRRGPVRLEPIRVLDVGHTGELPAPWLPDVSDDDMPAMQAFARLLRPPFVQFPVEPVGPGARWRYRYDPEQSPLGMPMQVEVELLGRDGARLELGLRVTVPGTRDPGEAASGYQRLGPFFVRYDPPVRIFDFAGFGEGRATINLERMTPVTMDVAVQFAARMEAHTDFGQQLIDYSPVVSLEIGED